MSIPIAVTLDAGNAAHPIRFKGRSPKAAIAADRGVDQSAGDALVGPTTQQARTHGRSTKLLFES